MMKAIDIAGHTFYIPDEHKETIYRRWDYASNHGKRYWEPGVSLSKVRNYAFDGPKVFNTNDGVASIGFGFGSKPKTIRERRTHGKRI